MIFLFNSECYLVQPVILTPTLSVLWLNIVGNKGILIIGGSGAYYRWLEMHSSHLTVSVLWLNIVGNKGILIIGGSGA